MHVIILYWATHKSHGGQRLPAILVTDSPVCCYWVLWWYAWIEVWRHGIYWWRGVRSHGCHWGCWRWCQQLLEWNTLWHFSWKTVPKLWGWSDRERWGVPECGEKRCVVQCTVLGSSLHAEQLIIWLVVSVTNAFRTDKGWHGAECVQSHALHTHTHAHAHAQYSTSSQSEKQAAVAWYSHNTIYSHYDQHLLDRVRREADKNTAPVKQKQHSEMYPNSSQLENSILS